MIQIESQLDLKDIFKQEANRMLITSDLYERFEKVYLQLSLMDKKFSIDSCWKIKEMSSLLGQIVETFEFKSGGKMHTLMRVF